MPAAWPWFLLLSLLSFGCAFGQGVIADKGEAVFQEVFAKFSKSPISSTPGQQNQAIDEFKKILLREDVSPIVKTKSYILLCLSYIFQGDLSCAYNEVIRSIPVMEKSVQGQNNTVFSRVKSSIENGAVKDYSRLIQMPEFNENARQILERINLLIEGNENYRKSVEQCSQKYKPILKTSIENLIKENRLEGSEADDLRKKLEHKYLEKIEKDGYFLISDLKQDFIQYLFERLFSD